MVKTNKTYYVHVLAVAMTIACGFSARAEGYSSGFQMGQLVKFSDDGLLFKSGEGSLMLGNESTVKEEIKFYECGSREIPRTCQKKIEINPWKFSVDLSNKELVEKMKSLRGQYVSLKFREGYMKSLTKDTAFIVTDVEKVEPPKEQPKDCVAAHNGTGAKSEGFRSGRIVKVTKTGYVSKTWEIQMQVGNSGNDFIDMSVSEPQMARCLVGVLKSGKKVNVDYNQSFLRNPLNRDTTYDVLAVKPATNLDQAPASLEAAPAKSNSAHASVQ